MDGVGGSLLGSGTGGGGNSVENQGPPQAVQYQCSCCGETYPSKCGANPWWAITRELCPKCSKMQIPRIDISEPANQIEYHPALVRTAESERGGGGLGGRGGGADGEGMGGGAGDGSDDF